MRLILNANESPFNLPENIRQEIATAVQAIDYNRYPDPEARGVCEAFARYYNIDPDCVVAGNGSDELISVIFQAFLKNIDVFLKNNDFSMYKFYADMCGYNAEFNETFPTIFSNPCNPTGKSVLRDKVLEIVTHTQNICIVDEAYMDFWGQNNSVLNEVENYDNLIVLKTCSKNLGIAAARLGFAVANKSLAKSLRRVKSLYNVNSVTQTIGKVIFSYPEILREHTAKIIELKKDLYTKLLGLTKTFENIKITDTKANFVLLNTPDDKKLCEKLEEQNIFVRYFPEFIRITAGTEKENTRLLETLTDIFLKTSFRALARNE